MPKSRGEPSPNAPTVPLQPLSTPRFAHARRTTLTHPDPPESRLVVTGFRDGDEAGILDLFARAFDLDRTDAPARLAWDWRYRRCPAGRQIVVGRDADDGRIVSHYAAIPVRFTSPGGPTLVSQAVDSMVDHAWCRRTGTPAVFVRTARNYYTRHSDPRHHRAAYGFPSAAAAVVGGRCLGYTPLFAPLRTLFANLFSDGPWRTIASRRLAAVDIVEVARYDAAVDRLWTSLRSSIPFGAIRDATYLNWRYSDTPHAYRMFEIRTARDADLRAVFVLRHGWCQPSILAIADVLLAPHDVAALHAVLAIAIRVAHASGQTRVELWLPPAHWAFHAALALGMSAEPGPARFTTCLFRDEDDVEWYRRNWFFTIGDFDAP